MMLPMRRSHKNSAFVFNAGLGIRQKRGNAIVAVSGMLDGIFGSGVDRHVAAWSSVKVTDRMEEEADDGTITIRERERFTQTLALVYRDGRTAILTDGSKHP